MAGPAKVFSYSLGMDRAGRITADGGAPLELDPGWTPEHLVLAGLVRCTLKSLRFHADRVGVDASFDVELEPVPPGEELDALLAKAERDCFVGASLPPHPVYRWRVNGRDVAT